MAEETSDNGNNAVKDLLLAAGNATLAAGIGGLGASALPGVVPTVAIGAFCYQVLQHLWAKRAEGDIRKRDEIPDLMHGKQQGRHAKRVMAFYVKWYANTSEGDLLHVLGLFDRPAPPGAVAAVVECDAIPGLTERLHDLASEAWDDVLLALREARLLLGGGKDSALDGHPLVREYFGARLRDEQPDAWREAHNRLYEYYQALPEKDLPDTVDEMASLFQAVVHGCHAERHQEALDEVYYRRIQRGAEHYCWHQLGAFGADLSALAGFFDPPWERSVTSLTEPEQSFVLNEAAFDLRALGRMAEAAAPMQASLERTIALERWKNAAISASNLSELSLTLGQVNAAVDYAKQGVRYADKSKDTFQRMSKRTTLADALHQEGRYAATGDAFREAEAMQQERQPNYPLLYSFQGFQYCDWFLAVGDAAEAKRRALKFIEWRLPSDSLLDIALDHLTLGRATLALPLDAGSGNFTEAAEHLTAAVDGLRKAGYQDHLPRGLLARAALHRVRGAFDNALRDLDEAWEIAARGGMRLHQCDTHLEYARLLCAMSVNYGDAILNSNEDLTTAHNYGDAILNSNEDLTTARNRGGIKFGVPLIESSNPTDITSPCSTAAPGGGCLGEAASINPDSLFAMYDTPNAPLAAARQHLDAAQSLIDDTGYHRRDAEVLLGYAHLAYLESDTPTARDALTRAKGIIEEQGSHGYDREYNVLKALIQSEN